MSAAAAKLALAQPDGVRQAQSARDVGERVAVDEARADAREVAFRQVGKAVEQRARDDAVQHCVADELEALVVPDAVTAVGQRLVEEIGPAECVPEPPCEVIGHPGCVRQRAAVASNSSRMYMLPNMCRRRSHAISATTCEPLRCRIASAAFTSST